MLESKNIDKIGIYISINHDKEKDMWLTHISYKEYDMQHLPPHRHKIYNSYIGSSADEAVAAALKDIKMLRENEWRHDK